MVFYETRKFISIDTIHLLFIYNTCYKLKCNQFVNEFFDFEIGSKKIDYVGKSFKL